MIFQLFYIHPAQPLNGGPEFESLRFAENLITLLHSLFSKKLTLTEDLL